MLGLIDAEFKDDSDTVAFCRWIYTDRTMLVTSQLPVSEFCEDLADMVY